MPTVPIKNQTKKSHRVGLDTTQLWPSIESPEANNLCLKDHPIMHSGFQRILLAVLLVLVMDWPRAAHGLFGPPSCGSNRDCPPINRCSSGRTIFLTCPGGSELLGGRCERVDNFFCRVGNPLGLGGNCAGRTCRQCYENSDCWSRGGGQCTYGQCITNYRGK